MKIKTSDLTGAALDWAVAKCEFKSHVLRFVSGSEYRGNREEYTKPRFKWVRGIATPCALQEAEHLYEIEVASYYSPTRSWGIGGPIIEREKLILRPHFTGGWECAASPSVWRAGPTPLIAAMRCYVASKLGEEVEVPEEL